MSSQWQGVGHTYFLEVSAAEWIWGLTVNQARALAESILETLKEPELNIGPLTKKPLAKGECEIKES